LALAFDIAEACPAAGILRLGEIEERPADYPVAELEIADLLPEGINDAGELVAQDQRVLVDAGEMARDQLGVACIAQAGETGPDSGLA